MHNISKTAGDLATVTNYKIVCCKSVRSATVWFLVTPLVLQCCVRLSSSSVTLCIMAKRCVLEQKL